MICSAAGNALIVDSSSDSFDVAVAADLQTYLVAAGYSVTINSGVPSGSLSGYQQIWDVRYDSSTPLSASDITAYVAYLNGGGSLFLMGENAGYITRDNSIVSLITAAGGGSTSVSSSIDPNNTQTVLAPFTGPNSLSTVTFRATGDFTAIGSGRVVAEDSSDNVSSLLFAPGTLSNARNGALIVVLDVNFLDTSASVSEQTFAKNLIAYLAAPVPVGTSTVPVLSIWAMILLAASLAVFGIRRVRATHA
jgi:hypothetical protein